MFHAAWLVVLVASFMNSGNALAMNGQINSEPRISIDRTNTSVRLLLIDIFKQAKARYKLVDVGDGKATVHLTNVPLSTALRTTLKTAGDPRNPLTYELKNGIYVVHPVKATAPPKSSKTRHH